MKRGPQTLNFPTTNLHENIGDYVPPKARNDAETQRRQANPAGTVVLEAQHDGILIMSKVYDELKDDNESRTYLDQRLGTVCINLAWYIYANSSSETNPASIDSIAGRRFSLPKHAVILDDGEIFYETVQGNDKHIIGGMRSAAGEAAKLEEAHTYRLESIEHKVQRRLGKIMGDLGLRMAASHLVGDRADPYTIQTNVRNAGMDAIRRSRELFDGAFPTIAQLADLDSPLFVNIRRSSNNAVRSTFIQAADQVLEEQYRARAA